MQRFLILDYETRSEANLKKVGAFEYSRHPSTEILCVAWRIGTRADLKTAPTRTWKKSDGPFPVSLVTNMVTAGLIKVAHNAYFERCITSGVLTRDERFLGLELLKTCPPEDWACTASYAAALALPRSLDGVSAALDLPHKKDKVGHALMLKMCKPRRATKNNSEKWHESQVDLDRLTEYCARDIDAEVDLFLALPPLIPGERRLWCLDQRINDRGFAVDREAVAKTTRLIAEEMQDITKRLSEITPVQNYAPMFLGAAPSIIPTTKTPGIDSVKKVAALLKWLYRRGIFLPDLKAKTVNDAINEGLCGDDKKAETVLMLRRSGARASTAKYSAFDLQSRYDGRVRDHLLYHGTSTGRWSGRNLQPQNFPKGSIKDTAEVVEFILAGATLAEIREKYGDPMTVFSSILRAMVIPTAGKYFVAGDYAQIEVRVLFWLAGHLEGLKSFATGRDLYKIQAADIYSKPVEDVDGGEAGGPERNIGKAAILGCGFGCGPPKFQSMCWMQGGVRITDELAETAVASYRKVNKPVVDFWRSTERTAIAAVQKPGEKFRAGKIVWVLEGDYLKAYLPSGRALSYYKPEVRYDLTPWGSKRATLYHYDVHPKTRQWMLMGTHGGKLVENVTQAAARDFMAEAMFRAEAQGLEVVLTVHDELLTETEKGTVDELETLMSVLPTWATGCPIKVSGWAGPRYKKG